MKSYKTFAPEKTTFTDRTTGATVHQLTNYKCNSTHPYFTDDGWFDNDRRMLFKSDRDNATNIFSIELESGEINQLTDFQPGVDMRSPLFVNKRYNETYYEKDGCVYALSLETLESRLLYTVPKGFNGGGARPTGDGKAVVFSLTEDTSDRIKANLSAGYIGFRDIFEAKPDCRIVRVDLETGIADTVWQEYCWVGHVNPSPTMGNLISFCHEGPWQLVDHRIWVLDLETGKVKKIRERESEGEMVGHEYWFEDGINIGYQVHHRTAGEEESFFGFEDYKGENRREATWGAPMPTPDHIHSVGFNLVVGDSGKTIKAFKYNGKSFDGPRIICMHDGDFFFGSHHPHPRMTRDEKHVIYNSTCTGYCQIYMVDIPEKFEELPMLDLDKYKKK